MRAQAPSANREVTLAICQLGRYAAWSPDTGVAADDCGEGAAPSDGAGDGPAPVVADGGGELTGTGVMVDSTNGTEIERTEDAVSVRFAQANWESVTLRFDPGAGEQVHFVVKTGSPSADGPLSRVSNTRVDVSLPAALTLEVSVVCNGKSGGTLYFLVGGS